MIGWPPARISSAGGQPYFAVTFIMPILQNPRHERFAQGLARGLSGKAAYVEAGYTSNGNAAEVGAAKMVRLPKVAARVAKLQAEAARRSAVTVDDLVADLNIMFKLALATKNPAAGVSAVLGKAKLLGLIVDKAEITATQRKPMRVPHEGGQMSLEAWQAKFAPKRPN
ncbi:terminase small subunit [Mesorhizobium sp. M0254]|uniref:terminase small subunit n=1 Tax=Mesorhizobium sp. M0254 TaxID=2956927 RepID=UPI0033355224